MNRADEHRRFEELAVGHALSALEPEEEQQFLAHLASCAACERDVQEHRETVGLLALSADPVDPPPAVLQGIMASLPPAVGAPAREAGVTALTSARERRSRRTGSVATWLSAAAAAAALLSLGAWNLALQADRDAQQQYGDRLAAALRDLAEPGSRAVPLAEPEGDVLAVAVVHERDVSLVVDGLAPNDSGTSYVLWAQDSSGAVSPVGAFDVDDPEVDVVQDLPVDQDLEQVTAFLVSNEPGDVAPPVPSGDVLASGEA